MAERTKSGGGGEVTLSVIVAVWLRAPVLPVTVSVEMPIGVFEVVVTLKVELPEPVTDAGLNDAVAPDGRPLTLSATGPANPLNAAMLTV